SAGRRPAGTWHRGSWKPARDCSKVTHMTSRPRYQAVAVECVDQPLARSLLQKAGIRAFDSACHSDEEMLKRLQEADTLVHFFSDRPLPMQPILQSGIKRVIVAGPAAGCFQQSHSLPAFAGFDGEIYDTPALAVRSVAEHTHCFLLMPAKNMKYTLRAMEHRQ